MKWLYTLEKKYKLDLKEYLCAEKIAEWETEVTAIVTFRKSTKPEKVLLRLHPKAIIEIKKGYSWDGNSPKFSVFDLFWIGTPEGLIYKNKPITHYASLIHDILGQFKHDPQMPGIFRAEGRDLWFAKGRMNRDLLYLKILQREGFYWAKPYMWVVHAFGPFYDWYLRTRKKVGQGSEQKTSTTFLETINPFRFPIFTLAAFVTSFIFFFLYLCEKRCQLKTLWDAFNS